MFRVSMCVWKILFCKKALLFADLTNILLCIVKLSLPYCYCLCFYRCNREKLFYFDFSFSSANEKLKHVDVYCKYCKNKKLKQNIFHMKTSNNYRGECEKWMEKAFFQYCCLCYKQTTSHDFVFGFCVERSTTNLYDI